MKAYSLAQFGLENLRLERRDEPVAGPGQVVLDVRALTLNYRDLLVIRGHYNPRLRLPAVPISDAAGVVQAVGPDVRDVRPGDSVVTHFVPAWRDGRFSAEYLSSTLGTPGPGLAAERVALPAAAVRPLPEGYDFAAGAALPIAALTAWNAAVVQGGLERDQTLLTLGTGGVSIFALQIGKAIGARVIITSSSDEKLARARELGADETINYRAAPEWEKRVLELTGGVGADVTVETVGGGTLNQSLIATRAGGTVALLGALTGLEARINAGLILMKHLRVAGILVGSRRMFDDMVRFFEQHRIRPVIDLTFPFEQLPDALRAMEAGRHFGKIAVVR